MTPVRFLMRCRVEHARRLLAHRGASIQRVAIEVGFNDEAVFRRAFRLCTGMTPSEYRTQAAGQ